ncbi:DUF2726 domain-containing protein [Pseudoduganella sp. FT26W]|uniref:DUF2726 domain-containing protein n=1 Tax=Duganella aquatilis TaxID=2666082 RepID=A0A844CTS9_9BURK|nr:DUF2726 domain-containing protein [Duganella aquatilis]MRW83753.1 DUF2726 domain-containing protein [Duganella aquatilis]
MNPDIENLRFLLEKGDVGKFLLDYQVYRQHNGVDPIVTGLTQRVFPSVLRAAFNANKLAAADVVLLWRLVRDNWLLLVDNDLLEAINLRINDAVRLVEPSASVPVPALATFSDLKSHDYKQRHRPPSNMLDGAGENQPTELKRVAIASSFTVGTWSAVDAFDFRKNVCASQQEYEFLRAVRQYFPSLQAYPNVPLKNFIDIEKLEATLPLRARNFALLAQVDLLLCTTDEDPVMGFELDSAHHDSDEARERDELKNLLFKLAGLPLIRIRPADTQAVRAEDFYALLMAEAGTLDAIRVRRLRPRRTHDFLVPA